MTAAGIGRGRERWKRAGGLTVETVRILRLDLGRFRRQTTITALASVGGWIGKLVKRLVLCLPCALWA